MKVSNKYFFPFIILTSSMIALSGCSSMTQSEVNMKENSIQQKEVSSAPSELKAIATGRYLPFTPEVLTNAVDKKRVLFFYANWCPICIPADKSFLENEAQIPSDVILIRVNYNDPETDQAEKDLAKKYGVTYQHTFVQIDAQGNEVTKWNGGEIEELLSRLK